MRSIIFGLGNPGNYYANTRHNLGFAVLDELATRWGIEFKPGWGDFMIAKSNDDVVLIKPMTFMNRSGNAVLQFRDKHQENDKIMVVY
ncbi:MAG: aminoacyl-tRNA hydrolase, partial [Candidatus Marinimicrobia bacterium]|nr:aminoacyl-tRNA hydrolase [Candidatus Neomarinimicrobiota bacterium]